MTRMRFLLVCCLFWTVALAAFDQCLFQAVLHHIFSPSFEFTADFVLSLAVCVVVKCVRAAWGPSGELQSPCVLLGNGWLVLLSRVCAVCLAATPPRRVWPYAPVWVWTRHTGHRPGGAMVPTLFVFCISQSETRLARCGVFCTGFCGRGSSLCRSFAVTICLVGSGYSKPASLRNTQHPGFRMMVMGVWHCANLLSWWSRHQQRQLQRSSGWTHDSKSWDSR